MPSRSGGSFSARSSVSNSPQSPRSWRLSAARISFGGISAIAAGVARTRVERKARSASMRAVCEINHELFLRLCVSGWVMKVLRTGVAGTSPARRALDEKTGLEEAMTA